jgi:serine phosphatase RsbU (regulator of sigma subunit)/predicted enzyme related to lactoylglutathione lyase
LKPESLKPESGPIQQASDPHASTDSITERGCPECPYLRLFNSTVYVRDHEKSLKFYIEQLGFTVVADVAYTLDGRWVAIAPPDGSALLALVAPRPGTEKARLIGRATQVGFISEDINSTYDLWCSRGVHFQHPPQQTIFGVTLAAFQDIDGNTFELIGSDQFTRQMEKQRQKASDRIESERRATQELEIAKQVQARLFPQTFPSLATLEYAGVCIQARHVGGDYYDFLPLGQQRLGLLIGDISGKGIAAALLMANLQANLRSQFTLAREQPQIFLQSVNRLFYANTSESSYATVFFADYDDTSQLLRYVNCGHLSAILLRQNGTVELLHSTGTVLGLFEEWHSPIVECQLSAGDILALYTDGVTESFNETGEEFGEELLIEALRQNAKLPAQQLLNSVVEQIQRFSSAEQHDDITLIIARCTAAA